MKHDCENYNKCMDRIVMETLLNFGGRSQGLLPNCDICNIYIRKEGDENTTDDN